MIALLLLSDRLDTLRNKSLDTVFEEILFFFHKMVIVNIAGKDCNRTNVANNETVLYG